MTAGYYTDTRPYTYAIADAGGFPIVLLPGQTEPHLSPEVDGVLLAGGASVHPKRYGHDFDPTIERSVDEPRDHLEFSVLRLALERGVPILGICRGLQLINVFFGGTLHQNLVRLKTTIFDHDPNKARDHLQHPVTVVSGRLRDIFGSNKFWVNSIHEQGIDTLAPGLHATVLAEDNLVEGVESVDGQVLAVQWHPEELCKIQPQCAALFNNLVSRATARIRSSSNTPYLCGAKQEARPELADSLDSLASDFDPHL